MADGGSLETYTETLEVGTAPVVFRTPLVPGCEYQLVADVDVGYALGDYAECAAQKMPIHLPASQRIRLLTHSEVVLLVSAVSEPGRAILIRIAPRNKASKEPS